MEAHGIAAIDLVVVNLYAFSATVASGGDFATCIENVDIGGPCMIRAAAKNNAAVTIAVSPDQYPELIAQLKANGGATTTALRRRFAAAAYAHTAEYDTSIAAWFAKQVAGEGAAGAGSPAASAAAAPAAAPAASASTASSSGPELITRTYARELSLKYGCNPHQSPAFVGAIVASSTSKPAAIPAAMPPAGGAGNAGAGAGGLIDTLPGSMPFTVLNGTPGYINLLDAVNAYQLAAELEAATGLAGAASFKHVSPAGAAVAVPLSDTLASVYELSAGAALTPGALAYLRARNADPMCSFGDFAALSCVVDEATAALLKPEVSDGIVAPGFTPGALEILKAKKSGAFVILEARPGFVPPAMEYREVYGESETEIEIETQHATADSAAGSTAAARRVFGRPAGRCFCRKISHAENPKCCHSVTVSFCLFVSRVSAESLPCRHGFRPAAQRHACHRRLH